MEITKAAAQLRHQGQAINALAADLTEDEARQKPDQESWSALEVLNHLVDEEILDFRRHLGHILFTPDQPWPKIDPAAWVTEKKYNKSHLSETLQSFKSEREKSIAWLLGLQDPDWEATIRLSWGKINAGDMLASWLAHDLLHLRQLIELLYHLTKNANHPYAVEYAGEW